jgi:hypothetical protein
LNRERKVESLGKKSKQQQQKQHPLPSSIILSFIFLFYLDRKKNFDKKLLCTVLQQRILQIFLLNIL